MVRTQQNSRDGMAHFPPRRKGHFWFANRLGKRQALNGKFDREDQEIRWDEGVIVLPNRYAVRAFGTPSSGSKSAEGKTSADDEESSSVSTSSPVPGKKGLLNLPNEILTLVFENLVSTGGVLHFFPIQQPLAPKQKDEESELWCIHHMYPSTIPNSMFLDLALSSKRIKDLVYDIFYGLNKFVIQLSSPGIKKSVVQIDETLVKREGFGGPCGTFRRIGLSEGIESWCRIYDRMPDVRWRFLRSLKIQIVVGNGEEEMSGIKEQIGNIARCFEMVDGLKLRNFEVGFVESKDGDVNTRSLRVVKRNDDDGLDMVFLEDQENDESLRGMAGAFGWIQELLQPLWKIKALQDVMVVNAPDRLADHERAAKRRKVE